MEIERRTGSRAREPRSRGHDYAVWRGIGSFVIDSDRHRLGVSNFVDGNRNGIRADELSQMVLGVVQEITHHVDVLEIVVVELTNRR